MKARGVAPHHLDQLFRIMRVANCEGDAICKEPVRHITLDRRSLSAFCDYHHQPVQDEFTNLPPEASR